MKTGKWLAVAVVCAFLGGLGIGYIRNRVNYEERENTPPIEDAHAVTSEEESVSYEMKEKVTNYFEVCLVGENVVVYEVFDDRTRDELAQCEVDMNVLPEKDLAQLKNGIAFFDKEDALMTFEGFVS